MNSCTSRDQGHREFSLYPGSGSNPYPDNGKLQRLPLRVNVQMSLNYLILAGRMQSSESGKYIALFVIS